MRIILSIIIDLISFIFCALVIWRIHFHHQQYWIENKKSSLFKFLTLKYIKYLYITLVILLGLATPILLIYVL